MTSLADGPLPSVDDGGVRDAGSAEAAPPQVDGSTPTDSASSVDTALPFDASTGDAPSPVDAGCQVENVGPCDPVCQNCGPAFKCTIDPNNHLTAACLVDGTVALGGACSDSAESLDTCAAGGVCLAAGGCLRFCRTDEHCSAVSGACILSILSGGNPTPFTVCKPTDACDPVANTGCPTSEGCFVWNTDDQLFCLPQGSGGDGTLCPNGNECLGGHMCVGSPPTDPYMCREVCSFAPASPCPATYTCNPVAGLTTYGFCAP